MRAMIVEGAGPPEVLRLVEVDAPYAGRGEVRVRVIAAGVQPADCAARRGAPRPPGAVLRLPLILGNEFAGVVDEIGDGAEGVAVGQEVIGFTTFGADAEMIVVGAGQIVAKPAGMPWDVAGALSASGQTAHTALEELAVTAGETLVVHAAAGGVGTMAVQIARSRGARVIGTTRPANHDYLRALDAEPVEYGDGLIERIRALAPEVVDAALHAVGNGALAASLAFVADRRRIGTIVDFAAAPRLGLLAIRTRRSAERLAELVRLYESGDLTVHVEERFALQEAASAHRRVESGHVRGKVVLIAVEEAAAARHPHLVDERAVAREVLVLNRPVVPHTQQLGVGARDTIVPVDRHVARDAAADDHRGAVTAQQDDLLVAGRVTEDQERGARRLRLAQPEAGLRIALPYAWFTHAARSSRAERTKGVQPAGTPAGCGRSTPWVPGEVAPGRSYWRPPSHRTQEDLMGTLHRLHATDDRPPPDERGGSPWAELGLPGWEEFTTARDRFFAGLQSAAALYRHGEDGPGEGGDRARESS